MIRRYTLAEMGALWSEQARFERMLEVEIAVCRAQVRRGLVPASALEAIETRARVDVERIAEIEQTTDHDVIAFVSQVAETVGPDGRFLHLGLTSSDVVDTALALQLRAAGERLLAGADRLTTALIARARAEAGTVMMGRTHSVHAEPTTFGLKCAGWAFEVARGRERLAAATAEIATGKISGPVGTYSHLGPDLEAEVLADLGLRVDPVSTQIVQRDRHAAFLASIAILGGSLERLATEVRNLQHTEIAEVMEPFRSGQKGSSAMPHKRNPILSERIAGLARLLRGYAQAGFENQPLWHERDISHSSAERVILPDATILLDYMLAKTTGLVEGLVVRPERMLENIAARPRAPRLVPGAAGPGRDSRPEPRGRVRHRPAQRPACRRRADPAPRTSSRRTPRSRRRLPLADLDACFDDFGGPAARAGGDRPPRRAGGRDDDPARGARTLRRRCRMLRAEALFLRSGKVRDLYRLDDDRLLLVASDRLSAFDVVLPTPIPDKGRVLTGLSRFWFAETAGVVANHLLGTDPAGLPVDAARRARRRGLSCAAG